MRLKDLLPNNGHFTVRYNSGEVVVDLPGYDPDGDGDSVHIGAYMAAADKALLLL